MTTSKSSLSSSKNDVANPYDHGGDLKPSYQTTTQSTSFQCPEQFGYFADSSDCARYFVCVFGEALHETCTGGLYFSSELQTCDWPSNVLCPSVYEGSDREKELSGKEDEDIQREHSPPPQVKGKIGVQKKKPEVMLEKKKPVKDVESSFSTESSVEEDLGSNDLEQPAFDESIASFIDQNGDVYVHDGPGGLYSLIERTAAISDHDKPIVFRSAPSAALVAAVNSIEKVSKKIQMKKTNK